MIYKLIRAFQRGSPCVFDLMKEKVFISCWKFLKKFKSKKVKIEKIKTKNREFVYERMKFWINFCYCWRYNVVFMVLTYFLPIGSMTYTYARVGLELWGSQSIGEATQRQLENIKSKRRVGITHFLYTLRSQWNFIREIHLNKIWRGWWRSQKFN